MEGETVMSHVVTKPKERHVSRIMRKPTTCICENKNADQGGLPAKLISAFVFATLIVQYLYFLNLKFQASSHLQQLYSLVCVRPGQNPHCWFSRVAAHVFREKAQTAMPFAQSSPFARQKYNSVFCCSMRAEQGLWSEWLNRVFPQCGFCDGKAQSLC